MPPPAPVFSADHPFAIFSMADLVFMTNYQFIKLHVNEQGTEAAAATAVLIMAGSFIRPPPPQFVANRPFVAFLVNHSQTVLFNSLFYG
ncbi:hypothetical protein niasHS_008071 [Heterodera schachtii]|uniref:Serpin domain-containing protein n=1 Tax=Heterodera schachtii TaxID=97005 RepID=A0ABD2JC88_HETSC